MTLLATHEPIPLQPLHTTTRPPQQTLHLVRRARAQARDVAVVDEAGGDQGDEVGEEEVQGRAPEEERRQHGDERAEEEDRQ